ncbi:MAG TPA: trehalase family glycosidase [Candidatus Saccharimonadales bacterium]|nr:trehalase family glycosidase [Candidatus Saccharimonadales bacterium]
MNDADAKSLFDHALAVLHGNDRGNYIVPAGDLYPHQWLWDSCFISIGLRHLDVERAQQEIESLLRGQWANGMVPHIIFDPHPRHRRDHNIWQSWLNPHAPNGVITSGLTQPPMLAEAIIRVGQKMKLVDRRSWYAKIYPHLLAYHQWLYKDRASDSGLIILLHPYESGMDNSPPEVYEIREHAWPWWLKLLEVSRLDWPVNLVRRDVRHVPPGQRMSNVNAIAYWALLHHLRNRSYDSHDILSHKPKFALEDLAFNCILIRANKLLKDIAKSIGKELPEDIAEAMKHTEEALDTLWDEQTCRYYSRCLSGDSIYEATIATLLPLYAGVVTQKRAEELVRLMKKRTQFRTNFPLPSVPTISHSFNPEKYWQGPTWVNMNWLIMDGLDRYSFKLEAEELKKKTLKMVAEHGSYEYFNPLDGSPAGAPNFSWTAALTIDLLKS